MAAAADAHRETCRMVMGMAWASKRAEPTRSFADCMRGAWAFAKRSAKAAARFARAAAWGIAHGRPVRVREVMPRVTITAAVAAGKTTKAAMCGSHRYHRER